MGLTGLTSNTIKLPFRGLGGRLGPEKSKGIFSDARDSVSFGTNVAEESLSPRKKSFWRTVNRSAFGGKQASLWRKVGGFFVYPFAFVKNAFLWMIGKTEGFKTLHPLRHESRSQIMERIEKLNLEIKTPELRFPFSRQDVEDVNLHKNHLLKMHDSLAGLRQLQAAKDWESAASALERFLSANGKNNSESCANISSTHAKKLATGAPMKRLKLKQAQVNGVCKATNGLDTVVLPPAMSMEHFEATLINASPKERLKSILEAEQTLVQQFGLKSAPKLVEDKMAVESKLLKAGHGAQALLFDLIGDKGHVTLAVNIKGQIYHIDNLNHKSAQVNSMKDWLGCKRIEKLWYAPLKDRAHAGIAG